MSFKTLKKCTYCKNVLSLDKFSISSEFYNERKISSRCKDCLNAIAMYTRRYKISAKKVSFTIDEVSEIMEAYATGLFTQKELAISLGVSIYTINRTLLNQIKAYQ